MRALELRIPPPAITAVIAFAMWGVSRVTPSIEVPDTVRTMLAVALALAGFGISIAGVITFRLANTTINPMRPETTSALITAGIYRISRNPMYVGILFALVAWAIFLASAWAMIGPAAFILYISRFQIAPEERVLLRLFGAAYSDYKSAVRRWL